VASRARQAEWVRALAGPTFLAMYAATQFIGTGPRGLGAPCVAAIFGLTAAAVLAWRRHITTTQVMALEVLSCSLVADWQATRAGRLGDLNLYLHAGGQFLSGQQVYTTAPIDHNPGKESFLQFLYAPPTLPIFGLLSAIPTWIASTLWVAFSVASIVCALRLFGVQWRWTFLALLWPPIAVGIFVGNAVIPSVLLLAVAWRASWSLGLGTFVKPQNGVLWLWLLRRRAWRAVLASLLTVAGVAVITLPLTGLGLWSDWIRGLVAYQQSQALLPDLYGIGLGRWLPTYLFVALAVAVVAAALWPGGRKSLARLGLASVIASPSLWIHGFVFAIPEFLRLRGQWFWIAMGLCAGGHWPGPHIALGLAAAGWFAGPLVHRATERFMPQASPKPALHPLGERAAQRPRHVQAGG
jgi:Glycosyltransferase family 87